MKVTFLCASLESGRDGVGDYSRRLAGELIKQHFSASIVAFNDRHSSVIFSGTQNQDGIAIPVLRLPAMLGYKEKITAVKAHLENFKPEWVSLQYVPYAFNIKGIPFSFIYHLKKLSGNHKWHIMFHETWVGITKLSPVKHKITGFFQRKAASYLVKSMKPLRISTSNRLYQLVLESAGIHPFILPLFSNIPLTGPADNFQNYVKGRLDVKLLANSGYTSYTYIGIFGSLYPEANLESIISSESKLARSYNKKLAFIAFGRTKDSNEFNRLKNLFEREVTFLHLGELSEDEVSATMQLLDKAISCTPLQHIGKSGVYAAMRLHNVQVLLPVSDFIPEYNKEILEYNEYLAGRKDYEWDVVFVANQFVQFLNTP